MKYKDFLSENGLTAIPKIHVFKTPPKFEDVEKLNADAYIILDGADECFGWWNGKFHIHLFKVTRDKVAFDVAEYNLIFIDFEIEFTYDRDDLYNVTYISGFDKKYNSYDVIDFTNDPHGYNEEEMKTFNEIKKFKDYINKMSESDLTKMLDVVEGSIENEIIDVQHKIKDYLDRKNDY